MGPLARSWGTRATTPPAMIGGKVQDDRPAQEPLFARGLARLLKGTETHRIALMCAEKDPRDGGAEAPAPQR